MNQVKLSDILLLPRALYAKITAARWTLVVAVIVVGCADTLFPLTDALPAFFKGRTPEELLFNLMLAVLSVIILGAVDILFFSIPLFVLFNHFNRDKELTAQPATLIRLMKVYAITHVLIIPVNELVYFAGSRVDPEAARSFIALIAIYFYFIMRFWFSGVITRGINVLYKFKPIYRNLVFLVVFFWNMLLGEALTYISGHFLLPFIK